MAVHPPAILDHLSALADTTRSRILLLLDRHELAVSELCDIMQLPQSTVSRHLKALADSGWISSRAEGTSNVYAMTRDELDSSARRLWALVREQIGPTPAAGHDQRRLQTVLAERRTKSQEFFSTSAGQWDRVRDELFGERFHLSSLTAFADAAWTVGDLGCGTGQMTAALAPFVGTSSPSTAPPRCFRPRRSVCRDSTTSSSGAATSKRSRSTTAARRGHARARAAPFAGAGARAARGLARAEAGGRVLIVDMLPHEREIYRQQMGHVWLGFSDEHLRRILDESGFADVRIVPLSPDPKSKGPGLFVATAKKHASSRTEQIVDSTTAEPQRRGDGTARGWVPRDIAKKEDNIMPTATPHFIPSPLRNPPAANRTR